MQYNNKKVNDRDLSQRPPPYIDNVHSYGVLLQLDTSETRTYTR